MPQFDVAVHSLTSGSKCFVQKKINAVVTVPLLLCYGFHVVNLAVTSPKKLLQRWSEQRNGEPRKIHEYHQDVENVIVPLRRVVLVSLQLEQKCVQKVEDELNLSNLSQPVVAAFRKLLASGVDSRRHQCHQQPKQPDCHYPWTAGGCERG